MTCLIKSRLSLRKAFDFSETSHLIRYILTSEYKIPTLLIDITVINSNADAFGTLAGLGTIVRTGIHTYGRPEQFGTLASVQLRSALG